MKQSYAVTGMTCASCVAHVERAARGVLGEIPFTVSLLSSSITVTLDKGEDAEKIFKRLSLAITRAGYGLERREEREDEARQLAGVRRERKRLIFSVLFTALLMLVAMWHMLPLPAVTLLDGESYPVLFWGLQAVLTVPVLWLQRHFYKNGFSALLHGAPNMDSLVALGSAAAAVYGVVAGVFMIKGALVGDTALVHRYLHQLYLESAAMILTLVSVGKYLEGRARHRAAGAVRTLLQEEPKTARLWREDGESVVLLEELRPGDVVRVPAGEKIPADGVIIDGEGSTNESMLTGESLPRSVCMGEHVYGATLLLEGSLLVRIDRPIQESTLRQIAALLESTAASKAPAARLADKVSAVFVPIVIAISVLTAAVWLIVTRDPGMAFRTAVSVLVISCPCALGLATPTAITVGSGRGARFGILFKSAAALETLADVKYLLTDKTGTLTKGEMTVKDFAVLAGDEETLLTLTASLESHSSHPVAKPLCALCDTRVPLSDIKNVAGRGLSATAEDGERVFAGNRTLYEDDPSAPALLEESLECVRRFESLGCSCVLVGKGDTVLGCFGVADTLREDSADAIRALDHMGVTTVMLTGDQAVAADRVASEVGIKDYFASLLPADKERLVREYASKGSVAMVGDGINDAPALAAAHVGVAIGAGTGVAVESADVVLAGNSLAGAVAAIELGRATKRNIRQNLFWALCYNSVCIPVAAGVLYPVCSLLLTPMIASAAMSLSSVFVVCNALRLWRFTPVALARRSGEPNRTENKEKEKETMLFRKKEVEEYVIAVQGMACGHCAARVESALLAIKGVKSAKVDLAAASVTVCAVGVAESALKDAITAAGYTVGE